MGKKLGFGLVIVSLMLISGFVQAALNTKIEIREIHYRDAQEIVAIIQPLLEAPETILAAPGNQIILRAKPEHLQRWQNMLDQLDTPTQDLQVSVSFGSTHQQQQTQTWSTQSRGQQQGIRTVRVQSGQFARIEENSIVPMLVAASGAQYRRQDQQSAQKRPLTELSDLRSMLSATEFDLNQVKQNLIEKQKLLRFELDPNTKTMLENDIKALEIQQLNLEKQRVSLSSAANILANNSEQETKTVNTQATDGFATFEYHALPSGLFVQPVAMEERVQLVIVDKRATQSRSKQAIDKVEFESKVTVPYGEWVQVGQANQQQFTQTNVQRYTTRDDQFTHQQIWVKVEKVQ